MLNRIYTIGHSTRTLVELAALLKEHGVTRLADIRRFPGSRRHPHFSRESLEHNMQRAGIEYEHFEPLGGRRSPSKKSPNMAWESPQFRGYADHMGSDEFREAVERLLGSDQPTAVMCAEAVPWNCHRNLLSDDLVRRGIEVVHVTARGQFHAHTLSEMAVLQPDRVLYPPKQRTMF
ncbi:MAG TPA: DUF488 domain-containing protein [Thermoanaerobaculia bacterium]|nr:DUF488 domain-containing protein [Thermoanaerobaculia bacterium]